MSELTIIIEKPTVKKGEIVFTGYTELLHQATNLAQHVSSVEVTEENVKTTKKMLAAVNGKVNELEKHRIQVKKEILSPYDDFEKQVKEIITVVKDADKLVRSQVMELEEREKDIKREHVSELFYRRKPLYPTLDRYELDDFITSKHLLKSTSIKSVEESMVDWFESKKRDIDVINSMDNAVEVFDEYQDTKDLAVALTIVNDRKKRKDMIRQSREQSTARDKKTTQYAFILSNEKDANMLELFMKQNNIQYKLEKVEN